ncbi:MAG TPA: hypothetical protein VLU46_04530 [Thermoanaerobaculia bacterium]|nr:hypothetical protein [Thermoanaerobaculia bacterium]
MTDLTAEARTKAESLVPTAYLLPSMLAVNTLALFALDRLGQVPGWIKAAAALFLSF